MLFTLWSATDTVASQTAGQPEQNRHQSNSRRLHLSPWSQNRGALQTGADPQADTASRLVIWASAGLSRVTSEDIGMARVASGTYGSSWGRDLSKVVDWLAGAQPQRISHQPRYTRPRASFQAALTATDRGRIPSSVAAGDWAESEAASSPTVVQSIASP